MKAIGRLLAGCMVFALMLHDDPAHASPSALIIRVVVSDCCLGQSANTQVNRKNQADQLLKQCRQAMKEGKLDIAEAHLLRAERASLAERPVCPRRTNSMRTGHVDERRAP